MDIDKLIETLAAIEHERWSDWQEWVHTLYEDNNEMFDTYVERWKKQIATPYSELSEREKQSDRDQVNRYLPRLLAWRDEEVRKSKLQQLEYMEQFAQEKYVDWDFIANMIGQLELEDKG